MKIFKSYAALLLAVCMCVSLIPVPAFAAQQSRTAEPNIQGNEAVVNMQIWEEIIRGEAQDNLALTTDNYAEDVLQAISQMIDESMDYLEEHPEEVRYVFGLFTPGAGLETYMNKVRELSQLTKAEYAGPADVDSLIAKHQENYDAIVSKVKKKDYNSWYWDKYAAARNEAKAAIGKIRDLSTFLDVCECSLFITFSDYLYEEEDGEEGEYEEYIEEEGSWSDGEDDEYVTFLEEYDPSASQYDIYSKAEIRSIIAGGQRYMDSMVGVTNDQEGILFSPSAGLKKVIKAFTAKAGKYEDVTEIYVLYRDITGRYDEEYGVYLAGLSEEDMLSRSDYTRWENKLKKFLYSFDSKDYSTRGQELLEDVYYRGVMAINMCETGTQAQKIFDMYVKKLKAVPNIAREIRETRTKYLKAWKKKYKTKAYDQKAVSALISQGQKALAKAGTLKGLKTVYKVYMKKLDGTIRTFQVTVRKKGKGTVSAGKTVKYGNTFVLNVRPAPKHALKSVKINGKKQPLKYTYRIRITKKTKVKVVFK